MLKKLYLWIKKYRYYLFSILIPLCILFLVFCASGFIYGNKTILISDLEAQLQSFIAEWKQILCGDNSMFYSFHKGLGGNMMGTIAYYLMSPLYFVFFLVSNANLYIGYLIVIALKLALCGFTMFVFLKHHFPHVKQWKLLLFSTCYSLTLYHIRYCFLPIWFDSILLLPFVLLGIDRMIQQRKWGLYGITLFLCLLFNYYIGYMICLFSVIYFFYRLCLTYSWKKDKREIKCHIKQFFAISFLSGCMTMFLLLPTGLELLESTKAGVSFWHNPFTFKFEPLTWISSFFIGSSGKVHILNMNTFYLGCGLFILILVMLYFFNRDISKKEKWLTALIYLLFFFSMSINYLNYIWHAMTIPQGFYGRYTFLICFFSIYIACKSFFTMKKVSLVSLLILGAIFPMIGIVQLIRKTNTTICIFFSLFFVALYLILLYLFFQEKRTSKEKKQIYFLTTILVFAELFISSYFALKPFSSDFWYKKEVHERYQVLNESINWIKAQDDDFYRIENNISHTYTDPMLFQYYGVSFFGSSMNERLKDWFQKLGYGANNVFIRYPDENIILDAILGVKYKLFQNQKSVFYDKIQEKEVLAGSKFFYGIIGTEPLAIYKNPYALSLGFMVHENVKKLDYANLEMPTHLSYQNELYKHMDPLNRDALVKEKVHQVDQNHYEIQLIPDKIVFLSFYFSGWQRENTIADIYINGHLVTSYHIYKKEILCIEQVEQTDDLLNIEIRYRNGTAQLDFFEFYSLDQFIFEEINQNLKQNEIQMLEVGSRKIKGKIYATREKNILFTSIPYEKGWKIKVDGKRVDYDMIYDTFIGLELEEGEHILEFEFIPPGIYVGMMISLCSGILFFIGLKRKYVFQK